MPGPVPGIHVFVVADGRDPSPPRLRRATEAGKPGRKPTASQLLMDHLPGAMPVPCYAARTESRNCVTSSFSRPLSPDRECAADRICDDADPVSEAPRCTSTTLLETCCVPCA